MNIKMFIGSEDLELVNGVWRKEPNSLIMKPANSLVKQFLQTLKTHFSFATCGSFAWTDTGGTTRTQNTNIAMTCTAALGDTTNGMVVGTGTNAVTITDYALQTKIAHGTGASQLQYAAQLFNDTDVTVSGSTCYYDLTRTFTNGSGSDITVTEVGLYGKMTYYYLIDRTLYTKTIANGAGAIFTYRLQISV